MAQDVLGLSGAQDIRIFYISSCWVKLSCYTKSWLSGSIRSSIVGLNLIQAVVVCGGLPSNLLFLMFILVGLKEDYILNFSFMCCL